MGPSLVEPTVKEQQPFQTLRFRAFVDDEYRYLCVSMKEVRGDADWDVLFHGCWAHARSSPEEARKVAVRRYPGKQRFVLLRKAVLIVKDNQGGLVHAPNNPPARWMRDRWVVQESP